MDCICIYIYIVIINIYIYIYIYKEREREREREREMVDFGKSDKMIKFSGKVKEVLYNLVISIIKIQIRKQNTAGYEYNCQCIYNTGWYCRFWYDNDINHNSNTNTYTNTDGLSFFRYEPFMNFWFRFMATRGERHNLLKVYANNAMLTILCWRAAHLVMSKISVSRDMKIPSTSFNVKIQLKTAEYPTLTSKVQS